MGTIKTSNLNRHGVLTKGEVFGLDETLFHVLVNEVDLWEHQFSGDSLLDEGLVEKVTVDFGTNVSRQYVTSQYDLISYLGDDRSISAWKDHVSEEVTQSILSLIVECSPVSINPMGNIMDEHANHPTSISDIVDATLASVDPLYYEGTLIMLLTTVFPIILNSVKDVLEYTTLVGREEILTYIETTCGEDVIYEDNLPKGILRAILTKEDNEVKYVHLFGEEFPLEINLIDFLKIFTSPGLGSSEIRCSRHYITNIGNTHFKTPVDTPHLIVWHPIEES